jgi:putative transposase
MEPRPPVEDKRMAEDDDSFAARKHLAHGVNQNPSEPLIIFLTVCTKDRRRVLADPLVHDLLRSVWADASGWTVGRYVIMPDHLHLFVALGDKCIPFDNWVRYWKSMFSRRYGDPEFRWQSDHWDRRLRRAESYEQKWYYVRNNPVRQGLVHDPDDWPYQGEIHRLEWW